MWSGFFNFLGVMLSSGAVAFGIISLLPVELILQVGSSAGFAMVFALLNAIMFHPAVDKDDKGRFMSVKHGGKRVRVPIRQD